MATPSSSRNAKRSTTNLSELRLAPLSARFLDELPKTSNLPKSPYEEAVEVTYARHHPSYMQGRSAPTTPGILSRSSSRRHLNGGLSRRGSLYDDAPEIPLAYPISGRRNVDKLERTGGGIPKAKSEAALAVQQRLSGQGVPVRRKYYAPPRSRTGGSNTPRAKSYAKRDEEDWLSRAGAATNALLLESKGQAWLSSRDSAASLALDDTSGDDEGYEEMAALSASAARLPILQEPPASPTSPRMHRWGSRYGSRSASRRTSRRGSVTNLRTPLAAEGGTGYFDAIGTLGNADADFIREESEGSSNEGKDEAELEQLTRDRSMGLGGFVDRIVGFSLFGSAESEESGVETEIDTDGEGVQKRRALPPPPAPSNEGDKIGLWEDAAWLLSIAGRALTQ